MKTIRRSGRVVGVFGLPCAGKTTLIKILTESSKEIIAHIVTGDIARKLSTKEDTEHMSEGNLFPGEDQIREEILKLVHKRQSQGAEVVILDGCPRFDDQVQWMLSEQMIGPETGILVKIVGDRLFNRANLRQRNQDDQEKLLHKKIQKHSKMIDGMEKVILQHGIPYFTVYNNELVQAIITLAKYIGLRK